MSYGGFLAFAFASLVPNRIHKLITISPAASLQKQSMFFFLRCLFIAMQNCIPRIKVFTQYLSDEEFKTITHPTLLIVGEHEVQYNVGKVIERATDCCHILKFILFKIQDMRLIWNNHKRLIS